MEQTRAVVVSTACAEAELIDHVDEEGFPYALAYGALAPLLARWSSLIEVTRPESRLDHALWRARRHHQEPLHLSFLPLRSTYLTQRAVNFAFSFCAYPDIPNRDLASNPRRNYVSLANRLAGLWLPNTFSRQSFLRAGVKAPLHLVPVPIAPAYFELPLWEPGQRTVLDCPCYIFPEAESEPSAGTDPWAPAERGRWLPRPRQVYKDYVRPRLGAGLDRYLTLARRVLASACGSGDDNASITYPVSPRLELSGVVYSTIFNPFDRRKNWHDLISAFLLALGDRENAFLVVKLASHPRQAARAFNVFLRFYRKLGWRHRCKLAVVTAYLSDAQMVELTRASAYYVQATRAEGLGMAMQNFLAAARPGISPTHTAMADYFSAEVGFPVAAHPEPIGWPQDPDGGHTTSWHRLVWQSLHDQLQNSYVIAEQKRTEYLTLAGRARARLKSWASAESVWPRLVAALNSAITIAERNAAISGQTPSTAIAKAS